jgi:HSP20 family molecular chaperone IbpA
MPRDLGTLMWEEACELLERAERLQRQFFQLGEARGRGPVWEPPVDIYETAHEVWVFAAIPGVEAPRLEVAVEEGVLVLSGERALPAAARQAAIHRLEIPFGRFERRVRLPGGVYELMRRELADGCLTLLLRKLA